MIATPLALLTGGWVIFYVLKEPPRADRCSGHEAAGIDEYRTGLGSYATAAAAVLAALIAKTSPTKPTYLALAACAWLTGIYNVDNDAFEPHAIFGWFAGLFGGEAVLAIAAIASLIAERPRFAQLVYLWTALLVFVPGATGIVASEGTPGLCL